MKIAIEPFLLDNTLMNCCVYLLAAAWMGVRIRILPTAFVSLIGAGYAFVSLFFLPTLRESYIKLPCFLLLSMLLFRRTGKMLYAIPFILLAAALTGGTAMLLTLQFGGTVYADGTTVGTVPLRTALLIAVCAICMPRLIRRMLSVRKRHALHTTLVLRLAEHTFQCDAIIDSGNLLKEPVSGLAVVLIDRNVDRPLYPVPFAKASCSGVLYGERPILALLPQYGNAAIDCICAKAPEPIGKAQAVLPESLLPYDWRTKDDRMAVSALGSPARAASHWQTRYLMVRSFKRRSAASAGSRRGGKMYRTCTGRQGSEG